MPFKFINNDNLDNLYLNLNDFFLETCLKYNNLNYTWRFNSTPNTYPIYNSIEYFQHWFKDRFHSIYQKKTNVNVCVMHKIKNTDHSVLYTTYFVVSEPDKLYNLLSKTIKLKAFL